MEKVMNYVTGFFGGLVSIMMAIVPVTAMVTALGDAGFVGLLSLVFIMYFFLCDKCVK